MYFETIIRKYNFSIRIESLEVEVNENFRPRQILIRI